MGIESEARAAWDYLTKLYQSGKPVEIVQLKNSSSKRQNKFFHVVIADMGNHLGYTADEMKKMIKRTCYPTYEKNGRRFIKETRDLSTEEMSEVIRRMQQWAAENFDYYVPDPR